VFVSHIGGARTAEYRSEFEAGTAKWFHVQNKALIRGEIAPSAMQDVTHCAIAFPDASGAASHITHIYAVRKVSLVDRAEISAGQAGSATHGSNDKYWLFELLASAELEAPVPYGYAAQFRAWLTSLKALKQAVPT